MQCIVAQRNVMQCNVMSRHVMHVIWCNLIWCNVSIPSFLLHPGTSAPLPAAAAPAAAISAAFGVGLCNFWWTLCSWYLPAVFWKNVVFDRFCVLFPCVDGPRKLAYPDGPLINWHYFWERKTTTRKLTRYKMAIIWVELIQLRQDGLKVDTARLIVGSKVETVIWTRNVWVTAAIIWANQMYGLISTLRLIRNKTCLKPPATSSGSCSSKSMAGL